MLQDYADKAISRENAANELRLAGLTPNEEHVARRYPRHSIAVGHPIIKKVSLVRRRDAWKATVGELASGYERSYPVFEKTPELTKLGQREDVSVQTDNGNPYVIRLKSQESLNEFVKIAQSLN